MATIDERTLDYLLACRFGPTPSRSERLQIWASRMLNRLGLSRLATFPLDSDHCEAHEDELHPPLEPRDRHGDQ